MLQAVLRLFAGPLARELRDALRDRLDAKNEADRIEADKRLAAIEAAREIAVIEAGDRWSATRIGRILIVVPFGIWWSAIFVDSIIAAEWDVLALPPDIMDMAVWLVPAIVLADAGRDVVRWRRRR